MGSVFLVFIFGLMSLAVMVIFRLLFARGHAMLFMVKTKQKVKNTKTPIRQQFLTLAAVAILAAGFFMTPLVLADQYDEQIKQIQTQNNQNKAVVNELKIQADSYQGEIDRLQAQINGIQSQIRENEAKRDDLENQIVVAQAELERQKQLLGTNIKAMYVEGDISTLEMLASSKDLSEFLDKQQYRTSVQQKIKTTLDKITALKAQLREQKTQIEKLLADQQAMSQQLGATQAQQAGLLAYTQDQKNQYTAQIKANNAQIASLRAEQLAANRRAISSGSVTITATGNCGGGYPGSASGPYGSWGCNYSLDNTIDNWGMYNRECVSYTAFKVWESGRYMPYWGGSGNAHLWDDNARNAGIPVDGNPRVGDVAIAEAGGSYGPVGHAMYVESVLGGGKILVSQFNFGSPGQYSEMIVSSAGLEFIHF